jgi:hypothetical protein
MGDDGGEGMFKVRYADFNDRSNTSGSTSFYCDCLSCIPDPELDSTMNGGEEVYGLGAVRYWWHSDFSRFQVTVDIF